MPGLHNYSVRIQPEGSGFRWQYISSEIEGDIPHSRNIPR